MQLTDLIRWGLGNIDEVQPLVEEVQAFIAAPLLPAVGKVEASFPIQLRLARIYDELPAARQQALTSGNVEALDANALAEVEAEFEAKGLGDRLAQLKKLWPIIQPLIPILIGIITKAG